MMPMPVPPPPIQTARFAPDNGNFRLDTSTVQKVVRPLPPPASRMNTRPVVEDRWGRMAGLGADTERLQVQDASSTTQALLGPIACGIAGFLLFGAVSR